MIAGIIPIRHRWMGMAFRLGGWLEKLRLKIILVMASTKV